jgi:hypothetical protein
MIRIWLFELVGLTPSEHQLLLTPMTHNLLLRHDSFGPHEMGIANKGLETQLANEYPLHER